MDRRRDRVFLAGIAASLAAHVAAVSVIAVRAASQGPAAHQIEFLPVEFTREASPVDVQRPQTTPPPPPPGPQPVPEARPVRQSAVREERVPHPPRHSPARPLAPWRQAALPGRPGGGSVARPGGGELDTGTPSAGGDLDLGPGGRTRPGWVPGRGTGEGSGTGPGRGDPEPAANPGPAAPPAPAPAPAPREVRVTVCQASGMLPGRYCQNTVTRTFREADAPTRVCTLCKAPEPPAHRSTQAETVKARFLSGPSPSIPASVRLARPVSVTCQYTVGTDGAVKDAEIVDSSGFRALDQEVLKAVRAYRYSPATQGGIPREVTMRRTFTFQPTD
jgi:TonB family protein